MLNLVITTGKTVRMSCHVVARIRGHADSQGSVSWRRAIFTVAEDAARLKSEVVLMSVADTGRVQ
jgi:hypothetical protein